MKRKRLMMIGLSGILAMSTPIATFAAQADSMGSRPPMEQGDNRNLRMQDDNFAPYMNPAGEQESDGNRPELPPDMNSSGQMTPPDMNSNGQMTPPDMNSNGRMNPPDMSSGNKNNTLPEKPMDEDGNGSEQFKGDESGRPGQGMDENMTPPEKPVDEDGNEIEPPEGEEFGAPGQDIDGQMMPPDMNEDNDQNLNPIQKIGRFFKEKVGGFFKRLFGGDENKEDNNSYSEPESGQSDMNENTRPGMPGQESDVRNDGNGGPNGHERPDGQEMPVQGGYGGNTNAEYTAANTLTEDSDNVSYCSDADGENAVLVDGDTVNIVAASVNKTGSSNGEDSDFYGTNAAVLASNGATLTISDTEVTTDGTHANAVFSYGQGTTLNISDTVITTTGNNSGGIMTTGGATTNATNLTVSTSGNSSAAIRTDRGGGTVNVTEGTYSTSGVGSPAIYSTADITVSDATLVSTSSEAVVIEGGNSVTLNNSAVSGNNSVLNGQSTISTNVLIYQSMSGDASEGSSSFTMNGGTLTSGIGAMFHVTNVTTEITLNDVDMSYSDGSDTLLIASADAWGKSGSNGGQVTFNLVSQEANGDISVDNSSSLTLNITDNSQYTGAINTSGAAGSVKVVLESGSTWVLTGDAYVDSFTGDYSGVITNGYSLYVNGVRVA